MSMNSAEFMHNKFYTDNSKTFCKTQLMNIYIENKKRKVEEQNFTPCKLVEKNASINDLMEFELKKAHAS